MVLLSWGTIEIIKALVIEKKNGLWNRADLNMNLSSEAWISVSENEVSVNSKGHKSASRSLFMLSTVTESRRWSVEEGWCGKESLTLKVFDVCLKALVHCP